MANALKQLFTDIADAIRIKTGETDKIPPLEFPAEIKSITGGSGNVLASSGIITTSSENTVNGVTTFTYNLGIMPDILLITALDAPAVTSEAPIHFMTNMTMSQALVDVVKAANSDAYVGFLYTRTISAPDTDYNLAQKFGAGYETLLENELYLGLGGAFDITENSVKAGHAEGGDSKMQMALGRRFFYLAVGNIL